MSTYVVATKRGAKPEGISVVERVHGIAGAEVKSAAHADRVLVEMTPEAAIELQERYPDKLIVEPIIMHEKLSRDDE